MIREYFFFNGYSFCIYTIITAVHTVNFYYIFYTFKLSIYVLPKIVSVNNNPSKCLMSSQYVPAKFESYIAHCKIVNSQDPAGTLQ